MRIRAKPDDNQEEIVKALRQTGATVQILSAVGSGCPDLLVGYRGVDYLLEVKDGEKPPSRRRLTPDEAVWHSSWRGWVRVVNSVDEALAAIDATG